MKQKKGWGIRRGLKSYYEDGWRLWRVDPPQTDWLCISAHGDERPENPIIGDKIGYPNHWKPAFYYKSLKGKTVRAESLTKFVTGAQALGPRDFASGWEVMKDTLPFESGLTKFQGRHGNDFENYGSIQDDMREATRHDVAYDVLTIRHRKKGTYKGKSVMFSEILQWLYDNDLRYSHIVCSFCRHDPYWRHTVTGQALK